MVRNGTRKSIAPITDKVIRMSQNPTGFYFPYEGAAGFGQVGFSKPMGKV
jgi:hypothetical protein